MKNIHVTSTEDSPSIVFDVEQKIFQITGRSVPENVVAFYQPIKDWFVEYIENPAFPVTLELKFSYFNTSSSKLILDILILLDKAYKKNAPVKVHWYYEKDDVDLFSAGKGYAELVQIPFEFISYVEED